MEKLEVNKKQPKISGLIRLLMFVGVILIVIDILQLSYQVNPNGQAGWQLTVAPSIKATTIVLALILCLPILLPLINRVISEGYIRRLTGTLRNEGIEEIETNILRIKLSADTTQSAEAYEQKVLSETETAGVSNPIEYQAIFERAYSEVTTLAQRSDAISSEQALEFIDELANYYDAIRENLPGGSGRTTLMTRIASLIWSLICSQCANCGIVGSEARVNGCREEPHVCVPDWRVDGRGDVSELAGAASSSRRLPLSALPEYEPARVPHVSSLPLVPLSRL